MSTKPSVQKAISGLQMEEPLSFERSVPERKGYSLPQAKGTKDIPEALVRKALAASTNSGLPCS